MNITRNYQITAQDTSGGGGYNYYGYINKDGGVMIMRENTAETEYRYFLGGKDNDFDTLWTARATLTYQKLDQEAQDKLGL